MIVVRGGTVIAFDGVSHRQLNDGVVAIEGKKIVYVGASWDGPSDTEIDARGKIVIPGQISTHAHVSAQELSRYMGDRRMRRFLRNGFLHFLPKRRSGAASVYNAINARASLRYGFASLVRGGVTTVVAYAPAGADDSILMREVADEMGIRLY